MSSTSGSYLLTHGTGAPKSATVPLVVEITITKPTPVASPEGEINCYCYHLAIFQSLAVTFPKMPNWSLSVTDLPLLSCSHHWEPLTAMFHLEKNKMLNFTSQGQNWCFFFFKPKRSGTIPPPPKITGRISAHSLVTVHKTLWICFHLLPPPPAMAPWSSST